MIDQFLVNRRVALLAILLVTALTGALLVVPAAIGQSVLGEYGGEGPGGGGGGNEGPGGGGGSVGTGDSAGDLPFTGYPMTPLVLTLLALLAVGMLVRLGITIRDRLQAKPAPPGPVTPLK